MNKDSKKRTLLGMLIGVCLSLIMTSVYVFPIHDYLKTLYIFLWSPALFLIFFLKLNYNIFASVVFISFVWGITGGIIGYFSDNKKKLFIAVIILSLIFITSGFLAMEALMKS